MLVLGPGIAAESANPAQHACWAYVKAALEGHAVPCTSTGRKPARIRIPTLIDSASKMTEPSQGSIHYFELQ
jgi:hypothetical protein